MAKNTNGWTTLSLMPLSGVLDVRSRPADLAPGAFRWKQNFQIDDQAKLCRRGGHQRFYADALYDNEGVPISDPTHPGTGVFYHNHDHHHQGAGREPITLLYENTSSGGQRSLIDGTQSRVSTLNEATGYWTDILTGLGAFGTRWKAATLQDEVILTNFHDDIYSYQIGSAPPAIKIPDLLARNIKAAKVVIEFNGFIILMNHMEDGKRQPTRITWSDLNLPLSYAINPTTSFAGFQDLDYGDEILAAAPMLGQLYVYTRRSIWKVSVATGNTGQLGQPLGSPFFFTRVYNEPKNQTGCLAYPGTLVSTGTEHYYLGREAAYRYSPYIPEPAMDDWLHRADGVIFRKSDTALSGVLCDEPIGEYRPSTHELFFSWPSGGRLTNNWTLVAHIMQHTADVVDTGYTALANFRRSPLSLSCNEQQSLLGASYVDYSIKDIGGVFFREYVKDVTNPPVTTDLPLNSPPAVYYQIGYNSILRGQIPTGLYDRDKIVRDVLLDHDTTAEAKPCNLRCRVADSFNVVDVNDTDQFCAPAWFDLQTRPLECPDQVSLNTLRANGQRPTGRTHWPCYVVGRFLWYEFVIENGDGSLAIGGDTCLQRADFDTMATPKPGQSG